MGAMSVGNPSVTAHHLASMKGHILGKSLMNVRIVENPSDRAPTLLNTGGSTQERSHMSAGTVGKLSHTAPPLPSTRELILDRPIPHVLGDGKALSYSSSLTRIYPVILMRNNTNIFIHKPSHTIHSAQTSSVHTDGNCGILSSKSSIPISNHPKKCRANVEFLQP